MDQKTNNIIDQVNQKLKNKSLFFISPEVERGIGLEEYLEKFFLVCLKKDEICNYLEKKNKCKCFSDISSTSKLPRNQGFINFIRENSQTSHLNSENIKFGESTHINQVNCYIQFFKNTSDSFKEKLKINKINAEILNNSAKLTRSLENKIKQFEIISKNGFLNYLPEAEVTKLEDIDYDHYRENFGNFIIQMPFGHTGSSTYMIFKTLSGLSGEEKVKEITEKYPKRVCRIVEYIDGYPLTVNACNYKDITFVGGLSYQYTGISGLTKNPAATVGNDWKVVEKFVDQEKRNEILYLTQEIGKFLNKEYGFQGLFGLDLVMEFGTNKIYLIEINPRQVASIPMHTDLQIENDQIPLALINLAEFLKIDILNEINIDVNEYSREALLPLSGSQLLLRHYNNQELIIPQNKILNGIYRQQSENAAKELLNTDSENSKKIIYLDNDKDRPIIWQGRGIKFSDICKSDDNNCNGFLLMVKEKGEKIKRTQEIARIQTNSELAQIINGKIMIKPFAKDTFERIKSILF